MGFLQDEASVRRRDVNFSPSPSRKSQLSLTKSVAVKTKGRKRMCVWQVSGLENIGLFSLVEKKLISNFKAKLTVREVLHAWVAIVLRNELGICCFWFDLLARWIQELNLYPGIFAGVFLQQYLLVLMVQKPFDYTAKTHPPLFFLIGKQINQSLSADTHKFTEIPCKGGPTF